MLTFVGVIFYSTSVAGAGAGNVPVVVAAHDLAVRVPVLPADVTIVQYHSGDVPPGAFSKVTDLVNVVAAIDISKGQPVTSNLLIGSTDSVIGPQSGYLPIPSGYVAVTIPTGEQQGVGGYIQVGDYISLVATVAGKTSTNIRTIYTNIEVIRVGPASSETAPIQGSTSNPPKVGGPSSSLTVVATECQAEFLTWFLSNGNLKYTLESYHDYNVQVAAADPTCPTVQSAKGVSASDIATRWPGILN